MANECPPFRDTHSKLAVFNRAPVRMRLSCQDRIGRVDGQFLVESMDKRSMRGQIGREKQILQLELLGWGERKGVKIWG
jgi:hypothetical protein